MGIRVPSPSGATPGTGHAILSSMFGDRSFASIFIAFMASLVSAVMVWMGIKRRSSLPLVFGVVLGILPWFMPWVWLQAIVVVLIVGIYIGIWWRTRG